MKLSKIPKSLYFILAILPVIIGMIALIEKKAPADHEGGISIPITPAPTASTNTEATSEIGTSNWKIYRNEKYGFEINYPLEFIFELSKPVGIDTITFADKTEPISLKPLQYKVSDYIAVYPSPILADEQITSLEAQSERWHKAVTVKIGDYNAFKFTTVKDNDLTVFIIRHGEIMVEIGMYPSRKHIDVSSFRFIR